MSVFRLYFVRDLGVKIRFYSRRRRSSPYPSTHPPLSSDVGMDPLSSRGVPRSPEESRERTGLPVRLRLFVTGTEERRDQFYGRTVNKQKRVCLRLMSPDPFLCYRV